MPLDAEPARGAQWCRWCGGAPAFTAMTCSREECLNADLVQELVNAQVELSDPIHVKRDTAKQFLEGFAASGEGNLTLTRIHELLRGSASGEGA